MMDNNHSEGWNRKALVDVGMRKSWWTFLWLLKQFFAVIASRYEAFEVRGFTRQRSADRKKRCGALLKIWNVFELLDRTNEEVVWKYVNCLYLCWENEYGKMEQLLNTC
eukprot:134998_1